MLAGVASFKTLDARGNALNIAERLLYKQRRARLKTCNQRLVTWNFLTTNFNFQFQPHHSRTILPPYIHQGP